MSESFAELLNEYSLNINAGDLVEATVIDIKRDYIYLDVGFKSFCTVSKQEFLNYNGELSLNVGDTVEVLIEELEDGYGSSTLSREKAKEMSSWKKIKEAFKQNTSLKAFVVNSVRGGGLIVNIDGVQGFLPNSLIDIVQVKNIKEFESQLIDVKIVKIDEEKKSVLVSRKATIQTENFNPEEVMKSIEVGSIVNGVIKNITEYGAFVDLGGVDGLLHITDMSWNRIDSPRSMFKLGQKLQLKVVRCDKANKKISLSLKELDATPWTDIVDNYSVNDSIKGKVSKINDLGVFVMLESGLEGLVFNTEIDWADKTPAAAQKLNIGDDVEAKIIEIDQKKYRVSLSLKRMLNNPWKDFEKNNTSGSVVEGSVKNVTDFGVFVDLGNGVSGVVPEELLSWSPLKSENTNSFEIGQSIQVSIKTIDADKEKILLSVRDLDSDPLKSYEETISVGDVVEGEVVEVSSKSITVKLAENAFGLIRQGETGLGDSSLQDNFSVNETVKAKIINLSSPNNRYVKLSIKEMIDNSGEVKATLKDAFDKAK